MDFISLLWSVLQDSSISIGVTIIIALLSVCVFLLIKEYGGSFIAHLFHRRNRLSLCGILLFLCAFVAMIHCGLFIQFPYFLRVLLFALYVCYIVAVLLSVKGPILFSRWYLKKHQKWMEQDQIHEHRSFLNRMPWYFLDKNEKINYEILKGKYLAELGDIRKSYNVISSVNADLLYPEEKANITIDLAFILLQLGNFSKAESTADSIKTINPTAYYFLKSYLSELQGDLDSAWGYAQDGENAIGAKNPESRILTSLYTQLGRLSFFRNNITEMFRYYYLALEHATKHNDTRMLHAPYQNLLYQIQLQNLHKKDQDRLMQEYTTAVANSSLKNMAELLNFRVALARQRCDCNAEHAEIISGYRSLHQITKPPEQYMIEVSTLRMLTNGKYDASEVLTDINQHFESYFTLPVPARFIALQDLTCPVDLSPEQVAMYDRWTPRLVEYAQKQAMDDLDEYEQSLTSDCVNERCWVILQRIDFTRRGSMHYDGQQVLQWMRELIQIYRDHGQFLKEIEAEVHMLKQFDEMIGLRQLTPDAATLNQMRNLVNDAYTKAQQIPAITVGALLVDIAHFSAKLGNSTQAQESLDRFRRLNQSPLHFSLELQKKAALLNQTFPVKQ